mmetsp:Transcript_27877/g.88158  ORF Transcript_27877/g.88158 Transcript_27877/m.88158 type:complete len:243 (+) Transcript_27877:549-1277(+)
MARSGGTPPDGRQGVLWTGAHATRSQTLRGSFGETASGILTSCWSSTRGCAGTPGSAAPTSRRRSGVRRRTTLAASFWAPRWEPLERCGTQASPTESWHCPLRSCCMRPGCGLGVPPPKNCRTCRTCCLSPSGLRRSMAATRESRSTARWTSTCTMRSTCPSLMAASWSTRSRPGAPSRAFSTMRVCCSPSWPAPLPASFTGRAAKRSMRGQCRFSPATRTRGGSCASRAGRAESSSRTGPR